jgi:flavodoxin
MRILIIYHSLTGNTQEVATAIHTEASQPCEAELTTLEDAKPSKINVYDIIIVGSPLHAGNLAQPVKDFLKNMPIGPGKKLACFVTHSAPAYPEQDMERFIEPILAACDTNRLQFIGSFSCQGFLDKKMHEMIRSRKGLTKEEWTKKVDQMSGHPDERDLSDARSFVRELLGK